MSFEQCPMISVNKMQWKNKMNEQVNTS